MLVCGHPFCENIDLCSSEKDLMPMKQQLKETIYQDYVQERLMLCNLQKICVAFREKHTAVSIRFSQLPSEHCIFADARQTHTVFVSVTDHNTCGVRSTILKLISMQKTLKNWYAQQKFKHNTVQSALGLMLYATHILQWTIFNLEMK
jgi:hypothetical protein